MGDHQEDCPERIRLAEEYGEAVVEFNRRFQLLRRESAARTEENRKLAEEARLRAESVWQSIENHLREHRCLELFVPASESVAEQLARDEGTGPKEFVLVANDDRQFVDASDTATRLLRLEREELLGRRIDDFFVEVDGETVPEAWDALISDGVRSGICRTVDALGNRKFAYRARANFAPGVHVGLLYEIPEVGSE
jgi:PAS domain-containing protein